MRISIASDLHVDTQPNDIKKYLSNSNNADVLVLAGDIAEFRNYNFHYDLFDYLEKQYTTILIIKGNHEHYNSPNFCSLGNKISRFFDDYSRIIFLDNSTFSFDGVNFIGTTLWTDINKTNPLTYLHVSFMMNDYRKIQECDGLNLITPDDIIDEHSLSKKFIINSIQHNYKNVVITHHAPSIKSWKGHNENLMYAYCSDLNEMIIETQINTWIHGHLHHDLDYNLCETRIVCNPFGYHGEKSFALKTIEV